MKEHLCDSCSKEFAVCDGKMVFASDLDNSLKGADADRVIKCQGYNKKP